LAFLGKKNHISKIPLYFFYIINLFLMSSLGIAVIHLAFLEKIKILKSPLYSFCIINLFPMSPLGIAVIHLVFLEREKKKCIGQLSR